MIFLHVPHLEACRDQSTSLQRKQSLTNQVAFHQENFRIFLYNFSFYEGAIIGGDLQRGRWAGRVQTAGRGDQFFFSFEQLKLQTVHNLEFVVFHGLKVGANGYRGKIVHLFISYLLNLNRGLHIKITHCTTNTPTQPYLFQGFSFYGWLLFIESNIMVSLGQFDENINGYKVFSPFMTNNYFRFGGD